MITKAQLNALSLAVAWGDIEKSQQDMAFLLIMPSITTGYERVFGLVAVWAHPHQAHYSTLDGVACKLVLLEDRSADWVYAFIWLNVALSHAPLSSEGHVSTMTDGTPSREAHCHLHQLQVCKQLQHKGSGGVPRRFEW